MVGSWLFCKNGLRLCAVLGLSLLLLLGCQPDGGTNGTTNGDGGGEEPLAQFTYQPAAPVIQEFIVFDGSASRDRGGDRLVGYDWDFGDGKTGRGAIAKHAYAAPGEYQVKLRVTNSKGVKGTAAQTVRVFGEAAVQRELAAPTPDPRGLAWDGQTLWVADGYYGMIYQIDPQTGKVRQSFGAPTVTVDALPMPEGLAWDGQSLWMISVDEAKILKLQPHDGKVLATVPAPSEEVTGLAWDGQALWASDPRTGKLYRVDPKDGRVLRSLEVSGSPVGLAWDGQALWVSDEVEEKLYRLDSQGKPTAAAKAPPVDGLLAGLSWDGQSLWLAVSSFEDSGKLYRVTVPR